MIFYSLFVHNKLVLLSVHNNLLGRTPSLAESDPSVYLSNTLDGIDNEYTILVKFYGLFVDNKLVLLSVHNNLLRRTPSMAESDPSVYLSNTLDGINNK